MTLVPEILTIYILDILFLFFGFIAFFLSINIFLKWDITSTSSLQYSLEKNSYLSATIIKYIFVVKIPLFIFFIFTLDKLSNIITGAMCGAGVVNATVYGTYLLMLKILNIYLFAFWLVLHNESIKYEIPKYIKLKFGFFIVTFLLLVVEIFTEFTMFNSIDPKSVVDCCGVIYSVNSQTFISYFLELPHVVLLGIFYTLFFLMTTMFVMKKKYAYALLNVVFIIVAILSLISFFGTYIYELPTHHCPFCFLQKEYNYIGYLLYILLFCGTFFGTIIGLIDFQKDITQKYFKISFYTNLVYVLVVSFYPLNYFLKNGVWL